MPAKTAELDSIILPVCGSSVGATNSFPVGITPAIGRETTSTLSTPDSSSAPSAAGESTLNEGTIISPALISSPI